MIDIPRQICENVVYYRKLIHTQKYEHKKVWTGERVSSRDGGYHRPHVGHDVMSREEYFGNVYNYVKYKKVFLGTDWSCRNRKYICLLSLRRGHAPGFTRRDDASSHRQAVECGGDV